MRVLTLLLLALSALCGLASASDATGPIDITSSNFNQVKGDWLLKFYAPWCGHCRRMEPAYNSLAAALHSSTDSTCKVGQIDGSAERVLTSRFGISGFPTIYYVAPDGFTTYKYVGSRTEESMRRYVDGGYKTDEPLSYLSGPFGPAGIAKGVLMTFGNAVFELFLYLKEKSGLGGFVVGGIMTFLLFLFTLAGSVLFVVLTQSPPKRPVKQD